MVPKTNPCRTPWLTLGVVVLVITVLLTPGEGYVLHVIGHQNKSHFTLPRGRSDSVLPRPQIIDMPEYTGHLNISCPPGQKPDGTGKCRVAWP